MRQPSPCVRALCETGVLFHMSHLKLRFALHTSRCILHTPHCTLHTPHFSLHAALFPIRTSHSTLHTSHFTGHKSHFSLFITFFTLHTSHCTLHTPHLISSGLFSPHPSSSLLISSLLMCHLSFHESLPSTTKEFACAVRQPGPCMRALFVAVQEYDLRATSVQCKHFPHTSHCTRHTPHSTLHTCTSSKLISSKLFSSLSMSSHISANFFLAFFMSNTSQY